MGKSTTEATYGVELGDVVFWYTDAGGEYPSPPSLVCATVTRVVDADTFEVDFEGREDYKVRRRWLVPDAEIAQMREDWAAERDFLAD